MKTKNIFLFLSIIFAQSVSAARLTIYNGTLNPQSIMIYTGSKIQTAIIDPGKQRSFDSGFHRFDSMIWKDSTDNSRPYQASIPSSTTMLMGSINLWNNGKYGINFDANGSSDKKARALMGTPTR